MNLHEYQAREILERFGIPFVATLHSLGRALRRHPECVDPFPPARIRLEDEIVAAADRLMAGSA